MKENQNIEWKASWRDEYIKWICGFANAAGGTLVIGKNDKGVVNGLHWDGVPVPHLSAESLDEKAVRSKRLEESVLQENRDSLLRKLHLIEGKYLKRAATLLFHEDPEQYVTGAYVKIGFFETDSDLIYQDEIHGNLFQQVDKTIDLLLTKYMKAYIRYEGLQRVEQYLFPPPALREALLNAIIHKDYSSGIPIQISVYEDKIYFWNNGHLPENWTVEKLLEKHSSQPFNPLIANAFFRTGLIEAWGRGIEKIHNECKQHGAYPPIFDYEPSGLMLLFKGIIPDSQDKATPRTTQKTLGKTLGKTPDAILLLLDENSSLSIPEIAERINKSESAVERAIRKLREEGRLKRIGPAKGGYWKIIKR